MAVKTERESYSNVTEISEDFVELSNCHVFCTHTAHCV